MADGNGLEAAARGSAPTADVLLAACPDALLLLGETYLKMHRYNDARQSFNTILQKYPRSALTNQAKNYIELMRRQGI